MLTPNPTRVQARSVQGLWLATDLMSFTSGPASMCQLMPLASPCRADEVAMIMTNLEKANQVSWE